MTTLEFYILTVSILGWVYANLYMKKNFPTYKSFNAVTFKEKLSALGKFTGAFVIAWLLATLLYPLVIVDYILSKVNKPHGDTK